MVGYEYRTSASAKMLPTETLTACLRSLWRSAGKVICALRVASLLTPTPANRLNATVFGFVPDVIFSVDSAAKRAVAISGVSAGAGLVLNFWYRFLYNGVTAAKFQVCSHSHVTIAIEPRARAHTFHRLILCRLLRSRPAIPSAPTLSFARTPDILYADILNRSPRFHILRFPPRATPDSPRYLLPCRGAGHTTVPSVCRTPDRALYLLGAQENRRGLRSVILTEGGGGASREGEG